MQALPLGGPQTGPARLLIVTGPVPGTALHGGMDMDHAGPVVPTAQDLLNELLLASVVVADELDLSARLGCQALGVLDELDGLQERQHTAMAATTAKPCLVSACPD